MAEGDTIHRTAGTLRAVLVGERLTRFEARRLAPPHPAPGTVVAAVEARGKHLLISFGDERVLHTHLRMTGSWHVYRTGERWRRSPGSARVVLGADDAVAVCFAAPVVELLDADAVDRHPRLRRLGPDLARPEPPLDEIVARARRLHPGGPVADLLLDQRVACGVGNVFKSEVCHLEGHHPAIDTASLSDANLRALYATAGRLLRANLEGPGRSTVSGGGGDLHVYGRGGRPCRRCAAPVVVDRLGSPPRVTAWCPACQPHA